MKLVTLDFETYWDSQHSLSKMSPIEYVMHPETELISCSIKVDKYPTDVFFGEAGIRHALHSISWDDKLVIAHNMSMFDSMILAWRLGIQPKMWGCTLAMARPLHGNTIGVALGTLVKHYGIGTKNNAVLVQTKGKHLKDFTPAEIDAMRTYNRDDTEQCHALFYKLLPQTPRRELQVIDSNVRMLVRPQFELNTPLLETALAREQAKKRKTLLSLAGMLGVNTDDEEKTAADVRDILMSATAFSELLEQRGVPVPMKPSPKDPEKLIPALAKTDDEFIELLDDDDDVVAAAAAARLEAKSTLLETRIQAFLRTGSATGGTLPIPARYYGAHTGRDSGELYNALNLPRINWDKKTGKPVPKLTNALRMSLTAPKGHVVIVADKSGIEMRLNHHLWKVGYSMELWRDDAEADIYRTTAAKYYNIDEEDVDGGQRQFGKVLQLACGFGIGAAKFRRTAWTMGRLRLSDAESQNGVQGWRNMHSEIADRHGGGWARCHEALKYIMAGQRYDLDPWGFCYTSKEGIHLPDERVIRYPDLRCEVNPKTGYPEFKYGQGRHTRYIYGGKVDENVIQSLGRTILIDDQEQFRKDTGLLPALRVYDELAYVVPEKDAEQLLAHLQTIMRTPPKWWPELVVWSEGDMAPSYGLAK